MSLRDVLPSRSDLPSLRTGLPRGGDPRRQAGIDGGLTPLRPECERFCRELTRREAANFYWGFIALPHDRRIAIYALYSFARQVDDAADQATASLLPGQLVDQQRARLTEGLDGRSDDPVMHVLAHAVRRHRIPREELEGLVRGVDMDLSVNRYQTWEDLRQYCLLVASMVGRMCVRIFGYTDEAALRYADDLGLAMQTANILRDIREDLNLGRVYLPQTELAHFGIPEPALASEDPGAGWPDLIAFQVERSRALFESGLTVTEYIPRRAGVCVRTMAGMYQVILGEIAADPYLPLRRRIKLDKRAKVSVMARSWLPAM